jgi:hypothetical protein
MPSPLIGAEVLPGEITVKGGALGHRVSGAPSGARLMVIFRRRETASRPEDSPAICAGAALRDRCGPVPLHAGSGARRPAAAPAAGGLPPIGRGPAAVPESPPQPRPIRQAWR